MIFLSDIFYKYMLSVIWIQLYYFIVSSNMFSNSSRSLSDQYNMHLKNNFNDMILYSSFIRILSLATDDKLYIQLHPQAQSLHHSAQKGSVTNASVHWTFSLSKAYNLSVELNHLTKSLLTNTNNVINISVITET